MPQKRSLILIFLMFFTVTWAVPVDIETTTLQRVLITGGNRGIGLALTKEYLHKGDIVYATYRDAAKSSELLELQKTNPHLVLIKVDLLDPRCDKVLQSAIGVNLLSIVIHNAGHFPYSAHKYPNFDSEDWQKAFTVNVIAPVRITVALEQNQNLPSGAKVIFMASRRAVLEVNAADEYTDRVGYCSAKAGAVSAAGQLARSLKPKGIVVMPIHPGHVATEMTKHKGMSPEASAKRICGFVASVTMQHSGRFFDCTTDKEFGAASVAAKL